MNFGRRQLISSGALVLCSSPLVSFAADRLQIRLWPDDTETRISLESAVKFDYQYHVIRSKFPYRLVLDLKNRTLTPDFERLIRSLKTDNRYIFAVRVGQFQPGVVRIVFDLQTDIQVDVEQVKPVASFGWRLLMNVSDINSDRIGRITAAPRKNESSVSDPIGEIIEKNPVSENKRHQAQSESTAKTQKRTTSKTTSEQLKAKKITKKNELFTVIIDAGHGGEDPGAVGRSRVYEKNVVLPIALQLHKLINNTRGMRAILTRKKDVFLPLGKRAGIAVKEHAHFFVSIHADAWTNNKAHGASVFTLSTDEASSLQARWLAQTQNRSDEIGGIMFKDNAVSIRSTLVDLLSEFKLHRGRIFADNVLQELGKLTDLHKNKVESAEFAVLKAQGVPSILVETGFLSNPADEKLLRQTSYQNKLARAIYQGILTTYKNDKSLV